MALPQVVLPDNEELYGRITRAFASSGASGQPSKEVAYAGVVWRRVRDNDHWKYVATTTANTIDTRYAQTTFDQGGRIEAPPPVEIEEPLKTSAKKTTRTKATPKK